MSFAPSKRSGGPGKGAKISLRSSHTSWVRLGISHRGAERTWRAPAKETDVLHEHDLYPAGPAGDTQRLRKA